MADSDCIIVHEQVVVPDAAVVEEMVALPGEKGDKGDPFTYDDFTPEQIADLQRPATEAAAVANQAAENANKATSDIKVLSDRLTAEEAKRESAESGRASAESERAEAEVLRETSFSQMQTTLEGLITDTRTATSNANTAAGNAENAATEANNSATLANEAADKANQAAESVYEKIFKPSEILIDLYNIIGRTCYRVYRFDDDCLYILHRGGVSKCDNYFNILFTLNFNESFSRIESGYDRNLLAKIGNRIFIATCVLENLIYMYDEDTMEGKYLDNPESLEYYGAIYAIGEKIYYFHRFSKNHIYIYNSSGELLKSMDNPYEDLKYSGGVVFTKDFHKFNTDSDEFEEDLIPFPDTTGSTLEWIFENGNMSCSKSYGFNISDNNNSKYYNFTNICKSNVVYFGKNKNGTGSLICNKDGIFLIYYPYSITNMVARQYQFIPFNHDMIFATEYKGRIYCTTGNNFLIIKDIRYLNYGTD